MSTGNTNKGNTIQGHNMSPSELFLSPVLSGKSGTSSNSSEELNRIIDNLQNCILGIQGGNPKTSSGSEFTIRNVREVKTQTPVQKRRRHSDSVDIGNRSGNKESRTRALSLTSSPTGTGTSIPPEGNSSNK